MIDTKNFPVMKKKCKTCPFNEEHEGQSEIANMVRGRCLQVSQICHHPSLHGKKETHLCRGGRDVQLNIFHKMGFIDQPTDEAWAEKRRELGV